jgi:hypothetical protein
MDIWGYTALVILAAAAAVLLLQFKKRGANKKLNQRIKAQWGRKSSEKYRDEDRTAIRCYFDNLRDAEPERPFLDDITWNDLDMDNIFKRLNSAHSSTGEEYLYALLREPLTDPAALTERSRLAEFFRQSPEHRNRLQFMLARLGKARFAGVSNYFFSRQEYKPFRRIKYLLQLAAFLLSPAVIVLNPPMGILLLIAAFFYNMTTYYTAKNELSAQLNTMSYMVNLISYSKKIANCGIPELAAYTDKLKKTASAMKGASVSSFYQIFYSSQDPLTEYLKVVFLVELIAFESINRKVSKHRKELRELFETVGLLDAMISVASFRESVPFYCTPVFSAASATSAVSTVSIASGASAGPDRAENTGRPGVSFADIYHPLIDEPVTNSAEMRKPALVTGSNASGKSTFLKTVAVNAIFAQTIGTCLAKAYQTCIFRIYTSMALRDDLQSSESYYIAEIKSLKRILDSLGDRIPLFCVIDEVLRGTNTIERIAASSEVMRYLAGKNCLCLTATHDIELTAILEGLFDNYHFQESFKGDTIIFDYRLYPGKSNTRNAIRLLEIMGYPQSTVQAARTRAEGFEREGRWVKAGGQDR